MISEARYSLDKPDWKHEPCYRKRDPPQDKEEHFIEINVDDRDVVLENKYILKSIVFYLSLEEPVKVKEEEY